MSNYMSDELSGDIKRDEMVSKGKMSQADADKERQLWTNVRFGMVATIDGVCCIDVG